MDPETPDEQPLGIDPVASQRIFLGMLAIVSGAVLAFFLFRPAPPPPPPDVAADPFLVRGREIYLDRCVSCHGPSGKGDGPTAIYVSNPPVGDLTDDQWKHGAEPSDVVRVISMGVPNAQMPGWLTVLGPEGVRQVAGYVYYLNGKGVPPVLRSEPEPAR